MLGAPGTRVGVELGAGESRGLDSWTPLQVSFCVHCPSSVETELTRVLRRQVTNPGGQSGGGGHNHYHPGVRSSDIASGQQCPDAGHTVFWLGAGPKGREGLHGWRCRGNKRANQGSQGSALYMDSVTLVVSREGCGQKHAPKAYWMPGVRPPLSGRHASKDVGCSAPSHLGQTQVGMRLLPLGEKLQGLWEKWGGPKLTLPHPVLPFGQCSFMLLKYISFIFE